MKFFRFILAVMASLLSFASAMLVFAALSGKAYAQEKPEHQKGKVISLDYKAAEWSLYPGTERNIKVYVPQQYDGKKPACLYIGLDGILCNAPAVFDKLIAEGKMPVTIGIFVQPGVIKGKDGNIIRYNRSNEFDFTDGRFAEFLDKEIIPYVEENLFLSGGDVVSVRDVPDSKTFESYGAIRISKDPNDRSIFGLSSGGIAAFNAAWQRPDLFRRVFSGVGTFVSMRGGNDLQMFVRKCEPKPLRIFLQDGSNDVWNATFGHWYEANQMLSTALDFAGYDTKYDWSDGYHSVKRSAEIFEDVMVWLWRDYPEPVKAGITKNDFLDKYIYRDEKGEPLGNLSDCGKHLWIKEKEIDKTEPSYFGVETHAERIGRIHSESQTVYAAYYPDDSFMVLEKSLDYTEKETNCLWQAICDNSDSNTSRSPYFSEQRFYWLHSYGNAPVSKGPMAFDSKGNLFVLTDIGIQVCDQNGRVRFILEIPDEVRDALLEDNRPHLPELLRNGGIKEYERGLLTLKIAEGKIIISDRKTFTYSRSFNISPAVKGQTPKSQGQG